MAAAPAVLEARDGGAFALRLADAANYGAGFSKSWNRVRIGSVFSVTERSEAHGVIAVSEIDTH